MSARILLAEDDRILRKAGETALRRKGYDVVAAVGETRAGDKADVTTAYNCNFHRAKSTRMPAEGEAIRREA